MPHGHPHRPLSPAELRVKLDRIEGLVLFLVRRAIREDRRNKEARSLGGTLGPLVSKPPISQESP